MTNELNVIRNSVCWTDKEGQSTILKLIYLNEATYYVIWTNQSFYFLVNYIFFLWINTNHTHP